MADANMRDFGKRVDRINRRHAKLSRGYVTSVNHDGLIIARPRARTSSVPWRGIMFLLVLVMAIKIVMHWQMGAGAYEAQVAGLAAGGALEQVLAYVLYPDGVTAFVSEVLTALQAD